jgi:EpsI family protein
VSVLAASARMRLSAAVLVLMAATSFVGYRMQPSMQQGATAARPELQLAREIPKRFGDWNTVSETDGIVVNPEIQASLSQLYSDILTRTYVNAEGYRVMVSVAYGGNQRGGLQAHLPEVCYPAQGFKLLSSEKAAIQTPQGAIAGRRLMTRRDNRQEPVTYWFSLGGRAVVGRVESRLEELRFAFSGQVPEGVLFRVSSIDADPARAHREHERFVAQLMPALPPDTRKRIGGL